MVLALDTANPYRDQDNDVMSHATMLIDIHNLYH